MLNWQESLKSYLNENNFSNYSNSKASLLFQTPQESQFSTHLITHLSQNFIKTVSLSLPNVCSLSLLHFQKNSYFMFGKMDSQGNLEGYYTQQLANRMRLTISSLSSMLNFKFKTSLAFNTKKWKNEIDFISKEFLFGYKTFFILKNDKDKRNLGIGSEIYYCPTDKTGGISIGLKSFHPISQNEFIFNLNPLLGHFGISYHSPIAKYCQIASKFDFNFYSFESDLCFGLKFIPFHDWRNLLFNVNKDGVSYGFDISLGSLQLSLKSFTQFKSNAKKFLSVELIYEN